MSKLNHNPQLLSYGEINCSLIAHSVKLTSLLEEIGFSSMATDVLVIVQTDGVPILMVCRTSLRSEVASGSRLRATRNIDLTQVQIPCHRQKTIVL